MPKALEFIDLPLETQRRELKRLAYETVPEGEVKETAAAIGVEPYTLYRMRDESQERYNLIDPRLIGIMYHRQDLRILHFLAGLFGHAMFAVPQPSETHTDINRASTKALKTFSGMMEEVSDLVERLDDGENMLDQVWERELKDIESACRLAQGKLEGLLETVRLARGTRKVVKLGTVASGFDKK